jgi:hypothetical protein
MQTTRGLRPTTEDWGGRGGRVAAHDVKIPKPLNQNQRQSHPRRGKQRPKPTSQKGSKISLTFERSWAHENPVHALASNGEQLENKVQRAYQTTCQWPIETSECFHQVQNDKGEPIIGCHDEPINSNDPHIESPVCENLISTAGSTVKVDELKTNARRT